MGCMELTCVLGGPFSPGAPQGSKSKGSDVGRRKRMGAWDQDVCCSRVVGYRGRVSYGLWVYWLIVFIRKIMQNIAGVWRKRFILFVYIVRHFRLVRCWVVVDHMVGRCVVAQSKYSFQRTTIVRRGVPVAVIMCRVIFRFRSMIFGFRRMIFRLRSMIFRFRSMIFRLRRMIFRLRSMIFRFRSMIFRLRGMIFRFRSMIFRLRGMIFRFRRMIFRFRSMIFRLRSMIFRFRSMIFRLRSMIFRFRSMIFWLRFNIFKCGGMQFHHCVRRMVFWFNNHWSIFGMYSKDFLQRGTVLRLGIS